MPIKSVHITNYYHPNSGGISTSYNKLLEAANRHGRYVRLIVPGAEDSVEEIGEYGRIYFVAAKPSPIFDKRYRLMMPWKAFMPEGSPVKTILRDEKPDLIEIGEKYTLSLMAGLLRKGLLSVTADRPVLVHSSCERMDDNVHAFVSPARVFGWLSQLYMGNYNVPMFDFHLANSTYTLDELVTAASPPGRSRSMQRFADICSRFWLAPKVDLRERCFINQCGVDISNFSPARRTVEKRSEIDRRFDIPTGSKLLLYIGRLSPEKNLSLLPGLMSEIENQSPATFRLMIVGDGPYRETLIAKAKKLCPDKVIFAGQVADKEDLADIYANADAFVHPNPREPFGIAPLEAMASGLPLVAPNSGGVLSYANSDNAWLASPNPISFARVVTDVFSDDNQRQSRMTSALVTSKEYNWETSTDARFAAYDEMYEIFAAKRHLFDYSAQPLRHKPRFEKRTI